MKRQLHLNLFIHGRGHHEASWRHAAASPLALTDIRYYVDIAQRAEAALFDSRLAKTFTISGGMALRARWGDSPNFALAS